MSRVAFATAAGRIRCASRAALLVGSLLLAACDSEPAFTRQLRQEQLIDAIRASLLESAEAEKSAVLSTSDEESRAFALESEHDSRDIERMTAELRPLVEADGRPEEVERLAAFERTWAEVRSVDERLLALAVANTDLKASHLAASEGAAVVERFVDDLTRLASATSDPEALRALSQASIAALREQTLLLLHVPTPDQTEMDRLEKRMDELSRQVERDLAAAQANGVSAERLAPASRAWNEHHRIAAEVVRLSRENTNVLSFDVSVHEKRKVTKDCLQALASLEEAVTSAPQPAR